VSSIHDVPQVIAPCIIHNCAKSLLGPADTMTTPLLAEIPNEIGQN